jgi:hypothetical protein
MLIVALLPYSVLVFLLAVVFSCVFFLLGGSKQVYSADELTVNVSASKGIRGSLLASPPGSCTSVPNGLTGDCSRRALAATEAWLNGTYFHGRDWSDLREAAVPPSISASNPPAPPTNIGTSWIPEYCDRPSCGHLLKGDVIHIDENGDGRFDDTWYDSNGNGIRENGEVDRIRAEQFAWGATSTILDFNNLRSPSDPRMFTESGVSPPGLSRARVRVALGDNPECVNVGSKDCHLSTGGIGVIALPGSIPDDLSNPNDKSSIIDNNDFYGICDPDRFTGDLASIQRQLDNCLWKVGSTPVTAPANSSVTGQGNAVRHSWVGQVATKYTESSTPDAQDFSQLWFVLYRFESSEIDPGTGLPVPVPIDEALYLNHWTLFQADTDPNPGLNFIIDPSGPAQVSDPRFSDTYEYLFLLEHDSRGRRYGFDFSGNPIGPDPGDTALDPNLIGKTNPTDDPFWGADSGPLGFNTDFTTNAKSGVGQKTDFRFLYSQSVEGLLISCLSCDHVDSAKPTHIINYNFSFADNIVIGNITGLPHSP